MKPGYFANIARAVMPRAFKASQFGPMMARLMLGRPVWPKRDYEKLAREGYQQNPVVHACIDLIARAIVDVPWCLYSGKGDDREEIEDHPFLDLLDNPNPSQDRAAFLNAWVAQRLISGNAYLERTDEDQIERMELYAHRADRMKVIPGETGVAQAYEYTVNGQTRRIQVGGANGVDGSRPILHVKTYNPTDDWYGLSPLDPCAWAIDVHNAGWAWNKALLDNSGAPSGAFVYTGGENKNERMSPEMYDATKQALNREVAGRENAGNILLLEGGMDWKQMGFNPEQMQQEKALNNAARTIAFTLGVPPELVGIPGDKTYSNYQEARLAFYQETVIPLARAMVKSLSRWFARQLRSEDGQPLTLDLNLDRIDALMSVRLDHWDRLEKSTILNLNEKRVELGYEEVDGGDQFFTPAGEVPLNTPATVEGGADDNEADPYPAPKAKRASPLNGRVH